MNPNQSDIQKTLRYWPNTAELRQRLSIPLALTFSPTQEQNNLGSFNQKNLQKYRCQSCKAFINKFCLIRNENSYDCSLCGFSNQIDQKINKESPELNFMSYKFKALKTQRTIMSKERLFVFILDFSNYSELSHKYLIYSLYAIRSFLNHALKENKNLKLMLLGFDDAIQIFHIQNQIKRFIYWDQEAQGSDFPFSHEQVGLLNQSKQNIFTILDALEEQINLMKFRSSSCSKKIMEVVEYALKHTKSESGKIFVVSGLSHELQKFKVMRNYDSTIQDSYKHHFPIVKKQCLTENMQNLLNSTQMSVSFFIHKNTYAVIF